MIDLIVSVLDESIPLFVAMILIYLISIYFYNKKHQYKNVIEGNFVIFILLGDIALICAATFFSRNFISLIDWNNLSIANIYCDVYTFYHNILLPAFGGDFHSFVNIFGNVCLFIPFGFSVMWLLDNKKQSQIITLVIGIVFSIILEFMQMLTGRISDVFDILLYIIGNYLGILIYRYIEAIKKDSF